MERVEEQEKELKKLNISGMKRDFLGEIKSTFHIL